MSGIGEEDNHSGAHEEECGESSVSQRGLPPGDGEHSIHEADGGGHTQGGGPPSAPEPVGASDDALSRPSDVNGGDSGDHARGGGPPSAPEPEGTSDGSSTQPKIAEYTWTRAS